MTNINGLTGSEFAQFISLVKKANGTQLECMWKYLRDEIDRRGDE